MKLTKYEHACFTIEIDDQVLIVDPGDFTTDFVVPDRVAGIVITHEHGDHFSPSVLTAVYDKNPDAVLISLPSIVDKVPGYPSQAVHPGDTYEVGPFRLAFFGGEHALIHESVPVIENIGVLVNDSLYYPGDSFVLPNTPVSTLALPVGAPWLKIAEVIDFLTSIKPPLAFPTHDALFSPIGKQLADGRLSGVAESYGGAYRRIDGETIEIA